MEPLELYHPVRSLAGKQLFAAGTKLTSAAFQEIKKTCPPPKPKHYLLAGHGTVLSDLQELIAQPPYTTIYNDAVDRKAVMDALKRCKAQPVILESLDYFRTNDISTYNHALMVFALSILLTRHLPVPGHNLEEKILDAGPSHDLGKICVPLPILKKSDPLTVSERRYLEHHAAAGYALLAWYKEDEYCPAAVIARDHHERPDGTGYPGGKKLQDILVEIISACDMYDALISPRTYRPTPFDNRTALEELTELTRKNCLSKEIIQALVALNRQSRPASGTCVVSLERRGTPPADNRYGMTAADIDQAPSAHKH